MDFTLEDSVDKNSPNDNLVDTISEMFTDEHALDYSSPPLWDDYDDELSDLKTVNDDTYDDPFDSKEEKIKDSKILIDELNFPGSSDFLPFLECDSVFYEDFSKVDALPSTNNENKVFNPGILIHENLYEVTNCEIMEKNVKKTTNDSLILKDFNPPLYKLPFHKEVPGLGALLLFSSENEEKVFNPGILTSKRVHTSLLLELSHRDSKAFKVIKIFESPMEIFLCSYGEDIRLSINPFPPADRSDFYHEEFADELAHIISPSEYDHFCFKIEPELGNLTMDEVKDIFPTKEPRVHVPNVLPTHPPFTWNLDLILVSELSFAYIVWDFSYMFSRIQSLLHIFSLVGMKISFLTPASPFIILLCQVYLIGVELS
ncbi:hypothetical protein Tco_0345611 [Tanacetum coccineum]